MNEPSVLLQIASAWQSWALVVHSLISVKNPTSFTTKTQTSCRLCHNMTSFTFLKTSIANKIYTFILFFALIYHTGSKKAHKIALDRVEDHKGKKETRNWNVVSWFLNLFSFLGSFKNCIFPLKILIFEGYERCRSSYFDLGPPVVIHSSRWRLFRDDLQHSVQEFTRILVVAGRRLTENNP